MAAAPAIGALLLGAPLAAQTPPAKPNSGAAAANPVPTTLKDVVVVGGWVAPTTEAPKSAACEFLVSTDTFLRDQILASGGDPLMAPTIYLPTRFPHKVDFRSAPRTAPGSAIPEIPRQYRGLMINGGPTAADEGGGGDPMAAATDPLQRAIAMCRGAQGGIGSMEIAYRDKFLPTAFVLFDDGRYAESLDYFHKAFDKLSYENGGDEAALMIGKLYLGAPGVEADVPQAIMWLKRAAGARFDATVAMPQFDPLEPGRNTAIGEAAMLLARIYQGGFGSVAKDPEQSRKYFERAFYVGHVGAAAILGDIYNFGLGTPKDPAKAFAYYRKAAILGHAAAQGALAQMYDSGQAPGGRNVALALGWHTAAARNGDAGSLYALAAAYDVGDGVTTDPQRALGLYKLAAMGGSAAAQNTLGTYFYEGRAVDKDLAVARRWFEQAAVAGDPDAMFNLGAMMMKGEGGEIDRTRAWVWLKVAERGENPDATAAIHVLEPLMTSDERAVATKLLSPTNS